MRTDEEITKAIDQYADMVRRLCFVHLKNYADTEDIFQTVFLSYAQSQVEFTSEEHEKAWLIRVTINACKDLLKSFFRRHVVSMDQLYHFPADTPDEHRYLLEEVLKLPEKYRHVIYLFYYEGYTAVEISDLLNRRVNTIYTWLDRGRNQLRDVLTDELEEGNYDQ